MVEVKKGEIYYYIFKILKLAPIKWAILEVRRDYEGEHGLGAGFNVLESNDDFINGTVVSANQLDGVSVWGFNKFISKDNHVNIKRIFKGSEI